ncbi:MAG: sulfatase-like hydrolase/transferase [Chitinophagaceae bacterium]|nr:sulfatase-like hydrolase/transferase [Chitinophagaceae bacterium]MBK8951298.1 sulfatase-like hydrolase/transferase [Chitinophagaceae bacterium]
MSAILKFLKKQLQHRFGPAFLLLYLFIGFSFLARIILLLLTIAHISYNPLHILLVFVVGLFYDSIAGLFFTGLLVLYLWLSPTWWYKQKAQRIILYGYFIISLILLVFNLAGEVIFWQEYGNRYDFIAVDYLVYTHEVIQNIIESFPVIWIFSGITLSAVAIFLLIRKHLHYSQQYLMRFGKRTIWFFGYLVIAVSAFFFLTNRFRFFSSNHYTNELAGNGMYEFGTAYFTNEIDYYQKYITLPDAEAFALMRQQLATPETSFSDAVSLNTKRIIKSDSAENKWNVVMITVESLSRDFMAYYGNKNNITHYLDSLIPHSLFFSNFYATGTRTVRGLEALSLAIPPTPGQSIVRRPHNSNLFTLGNLLKEKGYECKFVYGGVSWFDNMGPYYGANGYKVVDKSDFTDDEKHFSTAWGYCDEDIFTRTLKECDKSYSAGKPFFNQVLTVSNHRPYTFPKGRISNNPDDQSREGAVAYTDWAINDFITRAKNKPWFANTLFIVVADHCASAAGKVELPVTGYQVPCLVYAPNLITPQKMERLMSQIDLVPTVLGLMRMNYPSKFFGYDIFRLEPGRERAFISTYQKLGFIKSNKLVVLSPGKKAVVYNPDFNTGTAVKSAPDSTLIKEAVAWYQAASSMFRKGEYKFR